MDLAPSYLKDTAKKCIWTIFVKISITARRLVFHITQQEHINEKNAILLTFLNDEIRGTLGNFSDKGARPHGG